MDPTAAIHAPGPAARPETPTGAAGGRWRRLLHALAVWRRRWRAARALARAEADLRAMSPRALRDLGLGDGEAHAAARGGRGYGDWHA